MNMKLITVLSLLIEGIYCNDPSSDSESILSFEQKDNLLRSLRLLGNTPSEFSKEDLIAVGVRLTDLSYGEIRDQIEEFEEDMDSLLSLT
jgi:hypothetical protein